MPRATDELFLRRALRLAMNGRGRVEPNPMVGCVLVKGEQIIGEGYHTHFGGPHAEPAALEDCRQRGHSPAGATAYVTLEPCCHTNKKTPPCAPRLIEAKVARVVVGCLDPNPHVNGSGVATLRAAGIEVEGPVLEAEAKQLIAPFLKQIQLGLPYVTAKCAETADAKIAGPGGKRMRISGEASSRLVHQLRARSDAIMIGARTMAIDDPTLTARNVELHRPLLRVVLASQWVEFSGQLLRTAREGPILLYLPDTLRDSVVEKRTTDWGIEFVRVPSDGQSVSIRDVLHDLGRRGVTHLLAEPGPRLAEGLFRTDCVDRLWVFRSPKRVEDDTAPRAAEVPLHYAETSDVEIDGDSLTEYLNPRSESFFAAVPSSDLRLMSDAS